jgi:hypothetical protein
LKIRTTSREKRLKFNKGRKNKDEEEKLGIPTRGNLFLPVRLLVWADGWGLGQNFKGLPNKSYCI